MQLIHGDCIEKMRELPENCVEAIVTDPPYELGFMGKSWDSTGIANNAGMWTEALRVLKPGGYLMAFSGTRTYHRMASAIEDAGFEVRDMIEWVYGSGFPKSLNIGKAVDKLQGNEREEIEGGQVASTLGSNTMDGGKANPDYKYTKGTSPWEGWGTALKPAHEPICMARKPLSEKTVAENCLKWGTGGINVDGSRVGYTSEKDKKEGQSSRTNSTSKGMEFYAEGEDNDFNRSDRSDITGRFPANLIHDNSEEVRECFPETKTGKAIRSNSGGKTFGGEKLKPAMEDLSYEDGGGNASRFFKSIIYTAKASKAERNKGCDGLEENKTLYNLTGLRNNGDGTERPIGGMKNNHPTVKPTAVMEYLIIMVSRDGATILDPFMGSGTTGVACRNLNRNFIGIELDKEYYEIARKRIGVC